MELSVSSTCSSAQLPHLSVSMLPRGCMYTRQKAWLNNQRTNLIPSARLCTTTCPTDTYKCAMISCNTFTLQPNRSCKIGSSFHTTTPSTCINTNMARVRFLPRYLLSLVLSHRHLGNIQMGTFQLASQSGQWVTLHWWRATPLMLTNQTCVNSAQLLGSFPEVSMGRATLVTWERSQWVTSRQALHSRSNAHINVQVWCHHTQPLPNSTSNSCISQTVPCTCLCPMLHMLPIP